MLKITEQEARLNAVQKETIYLPNLAKDIIEQISFEARESEYIDAKSGVSARMTISAMENLMSAAERRCLKNGLKKPACAYLILWESSLPLQVKLNWYTKENRKVQK